MTTFRNWVGGVVLTIAGLTFSAAPALADPSIWHISDDDSDIYIFGTVHILRDDVVWQTPEIMAAFESADTVYFEAPVNDPAEQPQMGIWVQRYGFNPVDRPLSSQLSDNGNALLARVAPRVGSSPQAMEGFRPWLASVVMTVQYITAQGYDANSGVEAILWPLASQSGKTLAYFETIEEQMSFFGNLPQHVEVTMLEQSLEQFEDVPNMLDNLVSAWAVGDQDTLDQLMNGDFRDGSPDVYEVIIVQRNERWADDLEALLDGSGTSFIAVGAGHLPGEAGVVNLLRQRGITVEGP